MIEDMATDESVDVARPDPVVAYLELAAVLLEIKQVLGPDALLERPVVLWDDEPVVADEPEPVVPFAVSIVPDQEPEPLEPLDPAEVEAAQLATEDLVPHHRPHRLTAPKFGRHP